MGLGGDILQSELLLISPHGEVVRSCGACQSLRGTCWWLTNWLSSHITGSPGVPRGQGQNLLTQMTSRAHFYRLWVGNNLLHGRCRARPSKEGKARVLTSQQPMERVLNSTQGGLDSPQWSLLTQTLFFPESSNTC